MNRTLRTLLLLSASCLLTAKSTQAAGAIKHVVVVIDENTSFPDSFNAANMPYMTNLIKTQGALAKNYYANTHPSIGNYLWLMTGLQLTDDDAQTPASFPVAQDNIIRELLAAGLTWKGYCQDIPSVGYTGGDTGSYAVRHCGLPYLTDVKNSATQKQNLVPFTQFAVDLAANQLPSFSFIAPNLINDGHDCTIPGCATPDNFLKTNLPQLLNSPTFNQDTLLIFLWDEANDDPAQGGTVDSTNGGGHIEWALFGAGVKQGYQQTSTTLYQHQSTLRFILQQLGVTTFPGGAAAAPDMTEFLGAITPPNAVPSINSAASAGGIVGQAFTYQIAATNSPISFTAAGLPPGLNINVATGLISGSPTASGSSNVTLTASNASGPSSAFNLALTISAAPPPPPPPGVGLSSGFFGMHIQSVSSTWPTVSMTALRTFAASWSNVETTKGVFNWTEMDAIVALAQQHGVPIYSTGDGVPSWFSAANMADYDAYLTALATRYKGKIEVYELWNEPEYDTLPPLSQFVVMGQHMRDIIRSIDPAAKIASPGCDDPTYPGKYWAAGGPADVDVVAMHGYPTSDPGLAEDIIGKITTIKSAMAAHGINKPFYDSEGSYGPPTGQPASYNVNTLADRQAFIARFELLQWSLGFSRHYWYSWDDAGDASGLGWGTLFNGQTNQLLPTAGTFQAVHDWMVGSTLTSPCASDANSTWTCPMTLSNGNAALAVWNTVGSRSYAPAVQYTQSKDLTGVVTAISGSITIGKAALLLVGATTPPPPPPTGAGNSVTISEKAGVTTANYPVQIGRPFVQGEISGAPQAVVGGAAVPTQADIKQRWPDGSVKHAILSFLIPTLPANGSIGVTFKDQGTSSNTPLTKAQMLDAAFDFDAQMALVGGVNAVPSARQMLQDWDGVTDSDIGPAKLWTKGPIATTIILADHTTAHRYDVGPGGSFRPVFQATFWPGVHKVRVRFSGEIANTEALQDLSYGLSLRLGSAGPATVYSVNGLTHSAMARWTRSMSLGAPGDALPAGTEFWIGGAPPKIAIDHNIAYVEKTRFTFNFDPSKSVSPAAMASQYSEWQGGARDLFGAGLWQKLMGTAGGRPDIGPYPSWTVRWLFTGDPRMKEMAFGSAELAAAWPVHLREGNSSKTMDLAGAVPGIGRVLSIRHRPTITFGGDGLAYGYTLPEDRVTPIGPITNGGWSPECAHQPEPWSAAYLLTGDYWFLEELWFWASYSAGYPNGAGYAYSYGRGPTGAEGGLYSEETRAEAWMLRSRATTAFVSPDGSPEKTYFTELISDAIAIEEGARDIHGTSFDGNSNWSWGHTIRRTAVATNGGQLAPLHQWWGGDTSLAQITYGIDVAVTLTASSLFEQNFMLLALGRAKELGFATDALLTYLAAFQTGALTAPGVNPYLISNGRVPGSRVSDGQYFPTFASLTSAYDPSWQTLSTFDLTDAEHGYPFIALTATSMVASEPNGPASWNFMSQHALGAPILNDNPKWAILPRVAMAPPADAAPQITTQPQNQTVPAGQTITFDAAASGVPPPTYQWQSRPGAAASFANIAGANSNSLTLPSVPSAASGSQYLCVATNRAGTQTTSAATLTVTVIVPPPPPPPTGSGNFVTISEKAGVTTSNYPVQIGRPFVQGEISGAPQAVVGGAAVPTQADIKQRWPDGSVKHAILSFLIPTLPANGSIGVTFKDQGTSSNTPLTKAQMLDAAFDFDAQMTLSGGITAAPSARQMLQDWDGVTDSDVGPAKLWTKGPIATTIILADHTTAHRYDVGPNGSFRPVFQATFWPGIHKVHVRFSGEIANTEALQDLTYGVSLKLGSASPSVVYSIASVANMGRSRWTRSMSFGGPGDALAEGTEFWIGGAPSRTAVNHNIAYLAQTKFVFNYDASKVVSESAMASSYAKWQASARNLFGAGLWQPRMGTAGGRDDIGPAPTWNVQWLFTGDFRMREIALGSAELSAGWPMHYREGNPAKTFDLAGTVPGVGHVISIRHRPSLTFAGTGLAFSDTKPEDRVTPIGVLADLGWTAELAHQPEPWSSAYAVTGDYWYLEELWFWGAFSAGYPNGAAPTADWGRGPTGSEGGLYRGEIRAGAWALRSRATTAFVSPDGTPEQAYFREMTNEAIAIEEGAHDIHGTSFDATANWNWGQTIARFKYAGTGSLPPLHQWSMGSTGFSQAGYGVDITVTKTAISLFEQDFLVLALGRAKELGFPADALVSYLAKFYIGAINDPTFNPYIMGNGRLPTMRISDGLYFPNYASLLTGYNAAWQAKNTLPLSDAQLGYDFCALGAVSMVAAEPGGGNIAWAWLSQRALGAVVLNDNPKWAILPRGVVAPPADSSPQITTQPQNQTVPTGQPAAFGVAASGFPLPTYQWQTRPGPTGTFANIAGANSNSYTLAAVQLSASGSQYLCVATNRAGTQTSSAATLTVTSAPAPPTAPPVIGLFESNPASIRPGQSSALRWTVTGATRILIDQGVGDVTAKTSIPVTPGASAVYTLTATNNAGSATATAQVMVKKLPAPHPHWPKAVSTTGSLAVDYDQSTLGVTFFWSLTPVSNTGLTGKSAAPGLTAATGSKSLHTAGPDAGLGGSGLSPGAYLVSVVAQDTQGDSDPATGTVTLVMDDFGATRVYPNPWRQDKHGGRPLVNFVRMPLGSTVKIFTISGQHVKTLTPDIDSVTWDLTNDSGDKVASGIYVYLIEAGGQKLRGKLALIR